MRWRLALATALSAIVTIHAGQEVRPQQAVPTFRGGVRVVEIDTIVRDASDKFVAGLTKDDFEVLEEGQSQEIAAVSMVNLPVETSGTGGADSTDTPASLLQSDDVGRVYAMILNSSSSEMVERVRTIAMEFIDKFLGPTDLMALMHGDRAVTQGLTNNREVLRGAVERYRGSSANVLALTKELAVNLNAVRGRRKAILYVGDERGISRGDEPGQVMNAPALARARQREYDDAVSTAVRNNVRIYPVDPRGYLVRFSDMTGGGVSAEPPRGPIASGLGEGMDARILASQTGGIPIVNTGNYRGNFEKIVRDNNGYYVIAFYSSAADGLFHRVKIRVKNRPELSVRSRDGYRATSPDVKGRSVRLPQNVSPAANELLRTTSPSGGTLPIEVFTAVFRGDGFDGAVLIGCHVPGASLNLSPNERVELSYVAVDRWGATRAAERRSFTLTLDDTLRGQVAQGGLRLLGRLALPRGQYQVRIVVHQRNGKTGSGFIDVEIPDYTELPLSVSDLVLASSHGPQLTTLEDDAVLRRALPNRATPNRRFRNEETLSLFGEIYNSQWVLTPQVGISTIIQSKDRRVLFRDEQTLATTNRGRGYYQAGVRLARFPPGEYRIVLEAYTRDGIPASASQELQFEVE